MVYGDYINENTEYLEYQIVQEGANIDIYKLFKDIRTNYKAKKKDFEVALTEGDIDNAKKSLKEIIDDLKEGREEVKKIDDSAFSSKVGSFCFSVLSTISESLLSIFLGGAVGGAKSAVTSAVKKQKIVAATVAKKAGIGALFTIFPILAKELTKAIETHSNMQRRIKKEIADGSSEKDAKKKIGGLYKNEILDYIDDLLFNANKLYHSLK